jgi:hypothetical protein
LLPKVQLHVSALDNSHLQVVYESLESSYTRFIMGCVQCGVGDEVGMRSRTCHGGWRCLHGVTALCIIELIIVRSMVSYYVCRTCMYTTYLSYMYVLCYSIQEYGICTCCNRHIN